MTNRQGPFDIRVGDRVHLRKPHPCGGSEWEVTRIGADIGIRCLTCARRVMFARAELEKHVKSVSRDDESVG
ncbi:MAG: DUF951 domain-containing protein [Anaerolineae bacterium]